MDPSEGIVKNDVNSLKSEMASVKKDIESLKNDVASLKNDISLISQEMKLRFDLAEHVSLMRVKNASCIREDSIVCWVKIPNRGRDLPNHNVNNLDDFGEMNKSVVLDFLDYYNLEPLGNNKDNKIKLAQYLGIPVPF
ncbi:hypothetical protein BpHYR1_035508 [Brachionus plicatilis]|uniref:Uncharacterized protein n=1 Tax=Brachionus plicatilis TaxID=10195 RepID=A0A3M7SCX5_BRAPC|nr:hypothetical protein BpHYR1_035508 [Brachionus plicatilis]